MTAAGARRPARRWLGWTLIGLGAGVAVGLAAVWSNRTGVAHWVVTRALDDLGADARFDLPRLDANRARVENLVVGPAADPTLVVTAAELELDWSNPFTPRLAALRAEGVRVALDVRPDGSVDWGGLAPFLRPGGGGANPLDGASLQIAGLTYDVQTPWGAVTGEGGAAGAVGGALSLTLSARPATLRSGDTTADLRAFDARLSTTTDGGLVGDAVLRANVRGAALQATDIRLNADAGGRVDGSRGTLRLSLDPVSLRAGGQAIEALAGTVVLDASNWRAGPQGPATREGALAARTWRVVFDLTARALEGQPLSGRAAALQASLAPIAEGGIGGDWTLDAADAAFLGHSAATMAARGTLRLTPADAGPAAGQAGGWDVLAEGEARLGRAALSRTLREDILVAAAPLPPPFGEAARTIVDQGLARFDTRLPLRLVRLADGTGSVSVAGPLEARAGNGLQLRWTAQGARPLLAVALGGDAGVQMGGDIALTGAGLAPVSVGLRTLTTGPGDALSLSAAVTIAPWTIGATRLAVPQAEVDWRGAGGRSTGRAVGTAFWDGPLAGMTLGGARADFDLDLRGRGARLEVTPRTGCPVVTARTVTTPAGILSGVRLPVCAAPGQPLLAIADGRLGGAALVGALALAGRTEGGEPVRLGAAGTRIAWAGTTSAPAFEAQVQDALYQIGPLERPIRVEVPQVLARLAPDGGLSGTLRGGRITTPDEPVRLTGFGLDWSMAAGASDRAGDPMIQFTNVVLRAADPVSPLRWAPVDIEARARLADGVLEADGAFSAPLTGMALGTFAARHRVAENAGEADFQTLRLVFTEDGRQPQEVLPALQGTIASANGVVSARGTARWRGADLGVSGSVTTENLDFSTFTLGPVKDVNGTVVFDDLLTLTTPPGQEVRVGLINPGIPVSDGVIRFRLLRDLDLDIESARWPFVGGELTLDPVLWRNSAPETAQRLTLRVVGGDVGELVQLLDFQDLQASGRFDGTLPLVVQGPSVRIEGGRLEARDGGGNVRYAGTALDAVAAGGGGGAMAVEALRDFSYSRLVLTVEGPLEGDLVTRLDLLGDGIVPVQGVARGSVPFRYNVTVTGPLGRIVRDGLEAADPRATFRRLRETEVVTEGQPPAPPAIDEPPLDGEGGRE